jgi:hypothetical protein
MGIATFPATTEHSSHHRTCQSSHPKTRTRTLAATTILLFFFFLMAAAPRWPPYTNHHKQRWQPQNRPANIRKHEQNHFFFLTNRSSGHHKTRTKQLYGVLRRYCPTGSATTNKKKPNYPRIKTSFDIML